MIYATDISLQEHGHERMANVKSELDWHCSHRYHKTQIILTDSLFVRK